VTIALHMHGNLRRFMPHGEDRATVETVEGATVNALLASLGADQDTGFVAVNNAMVERDHVLHPGDVVDCFEPVAAG
jgi:sulfur carrier protein ThiS